MPWNAWRGMARPSAVSPSAADGESGTADCLRPVACDPLPATCSAGPALATPPQVRDLAGRGEIRRDGAEDGGGAGDGETAMPPKWVRGHCTWRGDHDVCP